MVEGAGRNVEEEEQAIGQPHQKQDDQREDVARDHRRDDGRDTHRDQEVRRRTGDRAHQLRVQVVRGLEQVERAHPGQANEEGHREQREAQGREGLVEPVGQDIRQEDRHGQHRDVQRDRLDRGRARGRPPHARALARQGNNAGAHLLRQLVQAGQLIGVAPLRAPPGEDHTTNDRGEHAHRSGGESQARGLSHARGVQRTTNRGRDTETTDEADGQHDAEPVWRPKQRGEQQHTQQREEAPLPQVHAHGVGPHRARTLAHLGVEIHRERQRTEDDGDEDGRIVPEVLAELDQPQGVGPQQQAQQTRCDRGGDQEFLEPGDEAPHEVAHDEQHRNPADIHHDVEGCEAIHVNKSPFFSYGFSRAAVIAFGSLSRWWPPGLS